MKVQSLITFLVLVAPNLAQQIKDDLKKSLANHNSAVLPGSDVCGLSKPIEVQKPDAEKPKFPSDVVPVILTFKDNSKAKQGEFPWMAAIEYDSNGGIRCDGSLINSRYVLTAAHCLNETHYRIISVWIGMWKQSRVEDLDADKVKKLGIEEKIRHESFKTEFDGNDIALLRLNEDVTYTDYIIPICLPKRDLSLPPLGTELTVAGWGYITESGPISDLLLKVELPLVDNSHCSDTINVTCTDHQLCVGGKFGLDSCNGDSGGPIMLSFTNGNGEVQWYQPGIVSFGLGCGRSGQPAVYTRVSKYIDWILSKLK